VLAVWCRFNDWILRYDAAVVFDIYLQVCTRNHPISEAQDFCKAVDRNR